MPALPHTQPEIGGLLLETRVLLWRQLEDQPTMHRTRSDEQSRQYRASGEPRALTVGRGYKIARDDLEDFKRRRRTDQKHTDHRS